MITCKYLCINDEELFCILNPCPTEDFVKAPLEYEDIDALNCLVCLSYCSSRYKLIGWAKSVILSSNN